MNSRISTFAQHANAADVRSRILALLTIGEPIVGEEDFILVKVNVKTFDLFLVEPSLAGS